MIAETIDKLLQSLKKGVFMKYKYLCKGCFTKKGSLDKCPFCDFNEKKYSTPPHSLPLDVVLNNRYIVGRVLGIGGFGITYIAYDTKLESTVAIKEYLPKELALRSSDNVSVSPHSDNTANDFKHYMDSFIKEAKILAKFNNESGIVSVQDIFKENGTVYIVMYYVNGLTLEEHLAKNGNKLPAEEVVQIMTVIMESLKKVHDAGVIHRDISPDNIYITPDNKIKLLDFGAARYFLGEEKSTVSVVLKRGYAPLEQYNNKKENQGPWTDIYSIAATMYRAITGVKPPEALERMTEDELKSPAELGISVPSHIESAIMQGLSLKFTDRPKTLNEFIKQLEPVDKTEIIKKDSFKETNAKYRRIKVKALGLMAVAMVLLTISIVFSLIQEGNSSILKDGKNNSGKYASLQNQSDLLEVNPSEAPSSSDDNSFINSDGSSQTEDQTEVMPEPITTQTPGIVEETENTPDPEEIPSVTQSPNPTQLPEKTQTPTAVEAPDKTKTPEVTDTPSQTPAAAQKPEPKPEETKQKMPKLVDKTLIESISLLESSKLKYEIQKKYSDSIAAGIVIDQSIAAGLDVSLDIVVVITVSLGEISDNSVQANIITEGITIETDLETLMHTISMYKEKLPSSMPGVINVCIICTDGVSSESILSLVDADLRYSFQYNGRSGPYYRFNDDVNKFIVLLLYNDSKEFLGYYIYQNPLVSGHIAPVTPS